MLEALAGAGIGAAAMVGLYASLAPRTSLCGPVFYGNGRASRQLALTFDDGPNDPHTLRLLEILARENVRATFFLIGMHVAQRPDIVREILAAGHAIGNHTQTHPRLAFLSAARVEQELAGCQRVIEDAAGLRPTVFRPPYGLKRPDVVATARALGLATVTWSVLAYDWYGITADSVERHIRRQVRGGDVIVLHDGSHRRIGADRTHSVEAARRIVPHYKRQGFEFLTVPEMMETLSPPSTPRTQRKDLATDQHDMDCKSIWIRVSPRKSAAGIFSQRTRRARLGGECF
ncbi:MAG TPA: polysaccharide deacetylase family protein [Terriglobales bacterium]|nr:polysaccharide deacetylase family protein [Terriglobales bacterium]